MRNLLRALLAGGLGFAASWAIAACGSSAGLLSGNQANTLNNQLDRVSGALAAGHCSAAGSAARQLVVQVSQLPHTIDSTLRQNLDNGASTISQLAAQQCHPVSTQATTQTTTSTPTTTATTTTQATTTTNATPPPTTTSTTPVTPPTTTGSNGGPSGGGGLGGGNGSGGGSGGGTSTLPGGGLPGGAN